MARVSTWWRHSKTALSIWLISASIFFLLFHMALHNPAVHSPSRPSSSSSDSSILNTEKRSILYDKMERDLDEHGAAFLKHGETSQSLSLSDIFTLKEGSIKPILKVANPPVRANVLYLKPEYSLPISEAVRRIFLPYFDNAVWFQNSTLYHFSMFHASHHIVPVPATKDEVEAEMTAVKAAVEVLCPLKIVLDRVILTSTGVLLGCWQVVSGTDPITIRAKLRSVLPRAPEKQLYDPAILHTSFARLLGPPKIPAAELHKSSDQVQFFHELVDRLNNQIRGLEGNIAGLMHHASSSLAGLLREMAVVSELWYVEEYDVLALALNGRTKVRRFQLGCSRT